MSIKAKGISLAGTIKFYFIVLYRITLVLSRLITLDGTENCNILLVYFLSLLFDKRLLIMIKVDLKFDTFRYFKALFTRVYNLVIIIFFSFLSPHMLTKIDSCLFR